MQYFYIEFDEDQVKAFIKAIIDEYESGLHKHGTYNQAVFAAQERTMDVIMQAAEADHIPVNKALH